MHNINKSIIFTIVVLRILAAFYILINPIGGFILYMIFDFFDSYFLQHFAGMGWNSYQQLDKKLDIFGLLIMVYLGLMIGETAFLGFLFYRLVGQLLFFLAKKQAILLFFPNFVEPFFVWSVVLRNFNPGFSLLVAFFIFQIGLEYFLHIFWPTYLKKNGFPRFFRIFGLTTVKNWS